MYFLATGEDEGYNNLNAVSAREFVYEGKKPFANISEAYLVTAQVLFLEDETEIETFTNVNNTSSTIH